MKKACMYIYLDDERLREYPEKMFSLPLYKKIAEEYGTMIPMIARSVDGATSDIETAQKIGADIFLDLDHDLGENVLSGYDLCKLIVKADIPLVGFTIHSMNAVGRENMSKLLTHYGYKEY